jgi:cyclic pyranopterin phosphate synthase
MVAIKGLTGEEIVQFVKLARDYPLEVRFLEFMPLCGEGWGQDLFLSIAEIRSVVEEHFELESDLPRGDRVAETFFIRGGKGKVGFIASLTESFCDRCSRIRLSSDGKLFPCLFSDTQVSVKEFLRENASDEAIISTVRHAVRIKPKGNWFQDHPYDEGHESEFELKPSPMIHNLGG